MVINKFPNREVYEKIKAKGSLGANDVNVLEDYPGPELTEADKTEIAGKVIADGTEFTLSDFPTALKNPNALTFTGAATGTYDGSAALTINIPAGGSSGSGGALKVMSAVGGYIGIPAAELPENGIVWMCFGSGGSTELYTGTVTIQDAGIAVNDMLAITNGTVNTLDQVSLVSEGLAVYGLSTNDYRGVWQQVGTGGAAEATDKWTLYHEVTLTEALDNWTLDLPSGCKRASIEVFPGTAVGAGWKSIAVNGVTIPVINGKIDNNITGILVELDVNAPVKIIGMRGACASKPNVNGTAPTVLSCATVMPQNITVMTSIGVKTGALLVAGCKIKVYIGG